MKKHILIIVIFIKIITPQTYTMQSFKHLNDFYDIEIKNKKKYRFKFGKKYEHLRNPKTYDASFSSYGKTLALYYKKRDSKFKKIQLFFTETGKAILKKPREFVNNFIVSPDGKKLVLDCFPYLIDTKTEKPICEVGVIAKPYFSKNSNYFFALFCKRKGEYCVKIFDTNIGKKVYKKKVAKRTICSCSPDSRYFIIIEPKTHDKNVTLYLFDIKKRKILPVPLKSNPCKISHSFDSKFFAVLSKDGSCIIFDIELKNNGTFQKIDNCVFLPNKPFIFLFKKNGTVIKKNILTKETTETIWEEEEEDEEEDVESFISPNGTYEIIHYEDKEFQMFSSDTSVILFNKKNILKYEFSLCENFCALLDMNNELQVYDVRTYEPLLDRKISNVREFVFDKKNRIFIYDGEKISIYWLQVFDQNSIEQDTLERLEYIKNNKNILYAKENNIYAKIKLRDKELKDKELQVLSFLLL